MSVKYLSHLSHLSPPLKISGVVHLPPDRGIGYILTTIQDIWLL